MSSKSKFYLDTSIFMEMFKLDLPTFETKINEFADGRRFAAYYTAIELNRGFLQTLVAHYKKVDEIHDIPAAINIMNNEFGSRVAKYANTLNMYMHRFSGSSSNDYRIYLPALEAIILDMTDRCDQLVKHFVGHFEDHALTALDLYSSEEYDDFLVRCDSSSSVNLDGFWIDYSSQLHKIRNRLVEKAAPLLNAREFYLLEFVNELLTSDTELNYKHTSDFAISLDCPGNHEMVAHDHIFEVLTPIQEKKGGYVSF